MSETPNRTRPVLNRVIFALLTLVLGGLAGAFVWVFFFLLNHGINLFWHVLPEHIGAWWWPLAVCLVGGVAIGLFERRFGAYPEDLNKIDGAGEGDGSLRIQAHRCLCGRRAFALALRRQRRS